MYKKVSDVILKAATPSFKPNTLKLNPHSTLFKPSVSFKQRAENLEKSTRAFENASKKLKDCLNDCDLTNPFQY